VVEGLEPRKLLAFIPTTTALAPPVQPISYGQTVTLTATVSSPPGQPTPTGFVDFIQGGSFLAFAELNDGEAVGTFVEATPGPTQLRAQYFGDPGHVFAQSVSSSFDIVVQEAPTVTTLQVTPNPQTTARPVMLTASVVLTNIPGIPFGPVTFFNGSTPIGSAFTDENGVATLTLPSLPAGVQNLSAQFGGNGFFAPSASNVVPETIVAVPATTTTLYPSQNPLPLGNALLLTATVTPTSGAGTPTGTVTFAFQDGTPIGTATIGPGGVASLVTALAPEPAFTFNNLVATYSGDSTFSPSTSNVLTQYVGPPDGPEILSLTRLGAPSASALVFDFDEALHPATAQDPNNYVIVGPGGRKIGIASAAYDANSQTVTVTPKSRLAPRATYVVTVIGVGPSGVTDVNGRLLDGTYVGQPGTNYSTAIVPNNLAVSGAVPAAPTVNPREQLAWLRAEMAAYRASLRAARHRR
jgi:hypothetical protein